MSKSEYTIVSAHEILFQCHILSYSTNLLPFVFHYIVHSSFCLAYQKNREFTGVILCLVSNRFLYLSTPITKLLDILYSCLQQAIKVKTLTNLNQQILSSQNIPIIVERFIKFLFEHGLHTKGKY